MRTKLLWLMALLILAVVNYAVWQKEQVLAEGLGMTAENPVSATHEWQPPFWIFNGVAVGPSGAVYVAGDAANVIYRIPPAQ